MPEPYDSGIYALQAIPRRGSSQEDVINPTTATATTTTIVPKVDVSILSGRPSANKRARGLLSIVSFIIYLFPKGVYRKHFNALPCPRISLPIKLEGIINVLMAEYPSTTGYIDRSPVQDSKVLEVRPYASRILLTQDWSENKDAKMPHGFVVRDQDPCQWLRGL